MLWLQFAPLVLLSAAIIILPGLLVGATLRLRHIYIWSSSPALGLGAIGAWLVIWSATGARWGWVAYCICLVLLAILAVLSRLFNWFARVSTKAQFGSAALVKQRDKSVIGMETSSSSAGVVTVSVSHKRRLPFNYSLQSWLAVLGVLVMICIRLFVFLPVMGTHGAVPHWGDADFHLQGTLLVSETGNASLVGGLSDLYTPDASSSYYYPTLWHAWTALLVPFTSVVEATNAAVLAIVVFLWSPAVALLGVALRPRSTWVGFFAPVIMSPIAVFPGAVGVAYSIYPYTLSMIAVPTAIAALVLWQRGRGPFWAIIYAIAVVGSLVAQPSAALFPIVAGVIALGVNFVAWWYRSVRSARVLWPTVILVVAAGASLFGFNVLRRSGMVQRLGSYPRGQILDNPIRGFFDGTVAAISQPWWPWTLILGAGIAGMIILARYRYGWTYIGITTVAAIAYIAAAGPDSWLRVLTGPWYKDHLRLAAVATLLVAVAAAVFVSWALDWAMSRVTSGSAVLPPVLVAVFVAVGFCTFWFVKTPIITQVERLHVKVAYVLDDSEVTPLTTDSVEALKRLDQHFEPGERILSTHGNGGGFVPAYSELKPMIPLRELNTSEQKLIATDLNEIESDPEICEILNEHNVKGFMADVGREGRGIWGSLAGPPYTDVGDGFELVDQEGTFKVWRITACD